jgi:hypothetical protein
MERARSTNYRKKQPDNHFDRFQSMMFVNAVLTDADGKPARDPESGKVITEDDGCD